MQRLEQLRSAALVRIGNAIGVALHGQFAVELLELVQRIIVQRGRAGLLVGGGLRRFVIAPALLRGTGLLARGLVLQGQLLKVEGFGTQIVAHQGAERLLLRVVEQGHLALGFGNFSLGRQRVVLQHPRQPGLLHCAAALPQLNRARSRCSSTGVCMGCAPSRLFIDDLPGLADKIGVTPTHQAGHFRGVIGRASTRTEFSGEHTSVVENHRQCGKRSIRVGPI